MSEEIVRISELNEALDYNGADFIIDTPVGTKKATFNNLCSAISNKLITVSEQLTLVSNNWNNNEQTINYAHSTSKRNIIDISVDSLEEWGNCKVYAISETATGITFKCSQVPQNNLNFRVTSMSF